LSSYAGDACIVLLGYNGFGCKISFCTRIHYREHFHYGRTNDGGRVFGLLAKHGHKEQRAAKHIHGLPGYIENHIKKRLGDETLSELNTEGLQRFVAELCGGHTSSDDGKGLAAKTVRSIFSMLRGALACAEDYGYIIKNPCGKVRLPKLEEKEITVLSKAAQRKLENAILQSSDMRRYGVLICLYTGLRIGEVCGLKWSAVDLAQSELTVKSSLNRVINHGNKINRTSVIEVEPKTKKSRRIIPLPKFLVQILKDLKRNSKSAYVINMKSGKAVEPRMLQVIYKKLLKTAGIEHVNFHALRHTFATRTIELGADVKTISEILGHTNSMITVNLYVHSLAEQKRKAMQGLNAYFVNKNTLFGDTAFHNIS
jgi:integrase